MSALGQKQTLECVRAMSALPPKADIETRSRDVRFLPKADIRATGRCGLQGGHEVGFTKKLKPYLSKTDLAVCVRKNKNIVSHPI